MEQILKLLLKVWLMPFLGKFAFPPSLQQPFRPPKLIIGAGWRAFFATYNKALYAASLAGSTTIGPTILDLTQGPFTAVAGGVVTNNQGVNLQFQDLGWVKDFKATVESKIGQVRSGYRGAVRAQYRGQVGESFELKFNEYGRLQYRLATGTNVINLLGATGTSTVGPVGATGAPSINVTGYSAGPPVILTLASPPIAAQIGIGSFIVADQDYVIGQYGIQGDAGMPVFKGAVTDVDYIRRNSDYVSRVIGLSGNVLTLDQPFVGGGSGVPTPNFYNNQFQSFTNPQVRCEEVVGFAAREGGTFISEWTCMLICNTIDQGQLVIYYPHVSIQQLRDHAASWTIENIGTTDEGGMQMDAQFTSLAFDDPSDGETVCAYKAFYPQPGVPFAY